MKKLVFFGEISSIHSDSLFEKTEQKYVRPYKKNHQQYVIYI